MAPSNADLLEALADCLEGRAAPEALAMLESAGGTAARWAREVGQKLSGGGTLAFALERSGALREDEGAWLRSFAAPEKAAPALRCLALRRRAGKARVRAILAGLSTPLFLIGLTLIIDPLPAAVLGGPYFGPALRALGAFAAVVCVLTTGAWYLFGDRRTSPAVLRIVAQLPFAQSLARAHAETELAFVLAAFATEEEIPPSALGSAAGLVPWAPFRSALSERSSPEALGALVSEGLALVFVAGAAAHALPARLSRYAETTAEALTRTLRMLVRVLAFVALVVLSIQSLVRVATRGLPSGTSIPGLPGLNPNDAELKELDKIMKEGR